MTQMKQYAQYIYKDNEWRILGAANSSPFSKLTGTQVNPIYLTSLESGQYLIQGYIKIDATHDFAIPVNCAYDTNCIIGYELFTICKNTDVGTMSVSCNYGNFLYDITGDNPVLLEAQMYASTDDIPTKTSDLTNDSGFITSDSDEKVKQIVNTSSNSDLKVLFTPNVLNTDYTGQVNKNSNFTYNPSTKAFKTGGTVDGYKLAAASAKGVDTSIAAASTSTNLPTSQAVASFVEGKGYTSNTGTITGVSVNGTSVATSGVANITTATGVKGDSESSYRTGNVNITKANIGLGNVENKSSATIRGELTSLNVTTALGYTPINSNLKGANNGLAELDANGKVPSSQLPSYVDDVLEYTSQSAFPATGETGKIYIAQDTNKTYRWSGTAYTEISASLALGETSSTAYRGDRGKIAYDHSQSTHARTDATATAASATNGNIKINGTETTVYTHPNSGVSAGTYKSVTVDAKGHVTAGSNPAEINSNLVNGSATGSLRTTNSATEDTNYTIGKYAFVEGYNTKGSGNSSHAEGNGTQALGENSHAEGLNTIADAARAHAEGITTKALGRDSHAEGSATQARGNDSHAEGSYSTAFVEDSHAEGNGTSAKGVHSHAEGGISAKYFMGYVVSEDSSNLIYEVSGLPRLTTSNINYTGAFYTKNPGSTSFGYVITGEIFNSTTSNFTFAVSSFDNSIAVGDPFYIKIGSTSLGSDSHAEGTGTIAFGSHSHAEGEATYAKGESSHAEGRASNSLGSYSHAEGYGSSAYGDYSHAEGYGSYAYGKGSHAEGSGEELTGTIQGINASTKTIVVSGLPNKTFTGYPYKLAISGAGGDIGFLYIYTDTVAYGSTPGSYIHTIVLPMWDDSIAVNQSFKVINRNTCIVEGGHVEGFSTTSTRKAGHAEGCYTSVNAEAGHAEGNQTTVTGSAAHAEGDWSSASGYASHAEGGATIAAGNHQHTEGKFNIADNNNTYIHIAGNGTADSSRSNAYTLDWSGNGVYAGKVTVGSGPTNNMDVATKQYVDTAVSGVTPTLPNASSTTVGGIKVRYDANTYTLYMTNDGTDA